MTVGNSGITKKPSAIKSVRKFSDLFDVKQKHTVCRVDYIKTKRSANIRCDSLYSTIQKWKGRTKINSCVKQYLYDRIIHHPKVVKSPIENDCINVYVDVHIKKKTSAVIAGVFNRTPKIEW